MLLTLNTRYTLCDSTGSERGKSQKMLNKMQIWCRRKYEFSTSYTKVNTAHKQVFLHLIPQ
jgi:hypothetical protein